MLYIYIYIYICVCVCVCLKLTVDGTRGLSSGEYASDSTGGRLKKNMYTKLKGDMRNDGSTKGEGKLKKYK